MAKRPRHPILRTAAYARAGNLAISQPLSWSIGYAVSGAFHVAKRPGGNGDLGIPSFGLLRKRPLSWSIGYAVSAVADMKSGAALPRAGDLGIPSFGLLRKRPLSWLIGYGEETSPSLNRFFPFTQEALNLNYLII